jgi:hypothetical protein
MVEVCRSESYGRDHAMNESQLSKLSRRQPTQEEAEEAMRLLYDGPGNGAVRRAAVAKEAASGDAEELPAVACGGSYL